MTFTVWQIAENLLMFGLPLTVLSVLLYLHYRRLKYNRRVRPILTTADRQINALLHSGLELSDTQEAMLGDARKLRTSAIIFIERQRYKKALTAAELCKDLADEVTRQVKAKHRLPPPFPPFLIVSEDGLVWLGE